MKTNNLNKFNEIAQYFELPITEAAAKVKKNLKHFCHKKQLNVSVSKLKRISRELNVPRWPYRRVYISQKFFYISFFQIQKIRRKMKIHFANPSKIRAYEEEIRKIKENPRLVRLYIFFLN